MPFETAVVNVNFEPMSVCQHANVVRSVFRHPHISFLAKLLFTTVSLVRPVTVYNINSVNSAHSVSIRAFYYKYPSEFLVSET